MMRPLRIFTWHVHSSYLYSLSHLHHEIFVPVKPGQPTGYAGRSAGFPWPDNLREVPAEEVRHLEFDCVLFQSAQQYLKDQYEILSPAQQRLPKIYLEHDPPSAHLTDTHHIVDDPNVLLVHVTPFNSLMWDCRRTPTVVIDHGVCIPQHVSYRGDMLRGIVVVNNLAAQGRRLGADIYAQIHREIPLDLIGIGTKTMGGLGEVPPVQVPAFISRYRFFFNPIRYTSLSLAMCEAMMIGMPIIGLATTEMVTTIENGVSGYIDTDIHRLRAHMQELLAHPDEARRLGLAARRYAQQRFHIGRFVREWEATFAHVTNSSLDGINRVFHSSLPAREHVVLPRPVVNGNSAHPASLLRHCKIMRDGVVLRPYSYLGGDAPRYGNRHEHTTSEA